MFLATEGRKKREERKMKEKEKEWMNGWMDRLDPKTEFHQILQKCFP